MNKENWQQITFNDAILYCERAGFVCREADPFAFEIKEFYLPGTKIEFRYRVHNGDPMKFYVWPRIDGKDVTYDEFKAAVETAKNA